jgi:hypothetical protein
MANSEGYYADEAPNSSTPPINRSFSDFYDAVDAAVSALTPTEIDARLAQLFTNNPRPIYHEAYTDVTEAALGDIADAVSKADISSEEMIGTGEGSAFQDPLDRAGLRIINIHAMADDTCRRIEDLETRTAMASLETQQQRDQLRESTEAATDRAHEVLAKAEDAIINGQVRLAETSGKILAETHAALVRANELLAYAEQIQVECRKDREIVRRETNRVLEDTRSMWRTVLAEFVDAQNAKMQWAEQLHRQPFQFFTDPSEASRPDPSEAGWAEGNPGDLEAHGEIIEEEPAGEETAEEYSLAFSCVYPPSRGATMAGAMSPLPSALPETDVEPDEADPHAYGGQDWDDAPFLDGRLTTHAVADETGAEDGYASHPGATSSTGWPVDRPLSACSRSFDEIIHLPQVVGEPIPALPPLQGREVRVWRTVAAISVSVHALGALAVLALRWPIEVLPGAKVVVVVLSTATVSVMGWIIVRGTGLFSRAWQRISRSARPSKANLNSGSPRPELSLGGDAVAAHS